MPLDRRNAARQARIQIRPRASCAASERRGPGVWWPTVAITMACPTTRMQDAAIRGLEDNQRELGGVVTMECTCMGWRVAQDLRACASDGVIAIGRPVSRSQLSH